MKERCQTINAILQILPKVHLATMEVKRKRNLFAQTEKKKTPQTAIEEVNFKIVDDWSGLCS